MIRLVISGGGSGGHVYPALAVADALFAAGLASPDTCRYIGAADGPEADLAPRHGLTFVGIEAAALRGVGVLKMAGNARHLVGGLAQATKIIDDFEPQAFFATGGYVSAPVVVAASLRRVPVVLYLPDIEPGWAVSTLARLASRIAVTHAESRRFLPADKVVVTGYPVRAAFQSLDRAAARRALGLDADAKVLLVWGGSKGARSLNRAVAATLPELLRLGEVVHSSGGADHEHLEATASSLPADLRRHYHLYSYLHDEMPQAMAAADLAVCRAGAAIFGELPAVGLPAILAPYPHAGAHQVENARILAAAGAVVVVPDAELERLLPMVRGLLGDDALRRQMAAAMRRLARPEAADAIAHLIAAAARPSPVVVKVAHA